MSIYFQDLEVAYFDLDESADEVNDTVNDCEKEKQVPPTTFTPLPVLQQACFAMNDGSQSPLENLVKVNYTDYHGKSLCYNKVVGFEKMGTCTKGTNLALLRVS